MQFIKNKVWPIVAGLVSSSIVMMICEYINHQIFEFPEGMDTNNIEQVRAFAETLPWEAYVLVMLGYVLGAYVGGVVVAKFSREEKYRLTFVLALLLALAGISNYFMLRDNLFFYVLATPMFFVFTYLGYSSVSKN